MCHQLTHPDAFDFDTVMPMQILKKWAPYPLPPICVYCNMCGRIEPLVVVLYTAGSITRNVFVVACFIESTRLKTQVI